VLRAAYSSGLQATDDAALVETLGHHVRVVAGDPLAFKVTTPEDLARAERLVASWAASVD
jgi:4-diphosphocytidyl-2-methyl-D-erithritol synthase